MITLEELLALALVRVQDFLSSFANTADFLPGLNQAFGNDFNPQDAAKLGQAWHEGDFSIIPNVEVLTSQELKGANGAFAVSRNTIYLSRDYLLQGNLEAILGLLLEEIGHKVDSVLNTLDAPGDEGAIFAAIVQNAVGGGVTPYPL